jgi:hypothetical protein
MEVRSPREYELMKFMPVKEVVDTSKLVVSPMPGAVFAIKVKAGDTVSNCIPNESSSHLHLTCPGNAVHDPNGKYPVVQQSNVFYSSFARGCSFSIV